MTTTRHANGRKRYLAQAVPAYHEQLRHLSGDRRAGVKDYFDKHGISDWDIISKYQLGYVVEPLAGDLRFRGMLAIPYLSRSGVDSIRFRKIGSHQGAKYAIHTGTSHRLYNTAALFNGTDTIGVTEGEIDAIAATELLGLPSVGVPGSNNWDDLWKPLIRDDFQRVVIFADGDTEDNNHAGQKFASMVAHEVSWRGLIVQCPQGEDVSSMCGQGRAAELRALYSTSNQEQE